MSLPAVAERKIVNILFDSYCIACKRPYSNFTRYLPVLQLESDSTVCWPLVGGRLSLRLKAMQIDKPFNYVGYVATINPSAFCNVARASCTHGIDSGGSCRQVICQTEFKTQVAYRVRGPITYAQVTALVCQPIASEWRQV